MGKTLAEKVWDAHVVRRAEGEPDLLYIDLHLLHEVTSPQAFEGLRLAGRGVRRPDLTLATEDHNVPTTPGPITDPVSRTQVETLRSNCEEFGVRLFPMGDAEQGIVHVVGPQLGLTQPGMTVVCGDSHTSTHGAFGAIALGIGTSEVEHVLATQTLSLKPFRTMAIEVVGEPAPGVTAKDIILAVIAKIGTGGGQGYVLEYRGPAIEAMSMESRMTVCNMSIEAGARAGLIAPDETTFEYLREREHAPKGQDWDDAVAAWRELRTDDDATFDAVVEIDAASLTPFVTWGTNPGQGAPLGDAVPDPESFGDESDRVAAARALEYMGLTAGTPLRDIAVDTVFVGSCTNGRIEDLRAAAEVVRRSSMRRVASARLLDVPGDEPRHPRPRRAQRVDVEPQLRGPSGQGRAHPPREPARRGRHRRARHAGQPGRPRPHPRRRRRRQQREELSNGEVHHPHRGRRPAAPQQRRHRPDHPRRLPQARVPHGLRGRALRRLAR